MKLKVFVSRKIPEEGIALLRKECDVEVSPHDRVLSKEELIQSMQGKDALLCLLTDKIDAEVLDSNPNLRVVSNYAVGFNNVDVQAATDRFIPVTNTPGVLTHTVADHAFTLLMAISRRIAEADRFTREGRYDGWAPLMYLGRDIYGKTLGILGAGRIGKEVAKRGAKGFNMKILYYDVFRNKDFEKEVGAKFCTVEQVLKNADCISVHVPLLPQTKHFIGMKELNMMKRSAFLINTSRGPVIDEEALVHALKHNVIAGAAIDVFEDEPALKPGLSELDNVIITPHIASATLETRGAMSTLAAENLLAVLHGKEPKCQVNNEVEVGNGYKHPFHMCNGRCVKSVMELMAALESANDYDYAHHATHERNDFANWVKDVLKDSSLATALRGAEDRLAAIQILKNHIEKNTPKAEKKENKKPAKKTVKEEKKK